MPLAKRWQIGTPLVPFESEAELEPVVLNNYEYIFGPDSILLAKKLIKRPDGSGTIPHAFAVDLLQRTWYLVETELSSHGVWTHIAPQVANSSSRPLRCRRERSWRRSSLTCTRTMRRSGGSSRITK